MGNIPKNSLLQVVAEHLDYIGDVWHDQVSDAAIRRGSVALRALIVEGALQRAWKQVGFAKEPIVTTTVIAATVFARRDRVLVAAAGGAIFGGVMAASTAIFDSALSAEEIAAVYGGRTAPEVETMGIV